MPIISRHIEISDTLSYDYKYHERRQLCERHIRNMKMFDLSILNSPSNWGFDGDLCNQLLRTRKTWNKQGTG